MNIAMLQSTVELFMIVCRQIMNVLCEILWLPLHCMYDIDNYKEFEFEFHIIIRGLYKLFLSIQKDKTL